MALSLKSEAFADGGIIPKKYGYKHGNTSIPLQIDAVPEGTVSLALIMDDPDALHVAGKIWVHWVVWNIDPKNSEFVENSTPANCIEGSTDFGESSYGGPAPPDKEHTYIFKLYALEKKLSLSAGASKKDVESAMKNHILEETTLRGRYAP